MSGSTRAWARAASGLLLIGIVGPLLLADGQPTKPPSSKPARPRLIVQPADSIPDADQGPDCIFMPSQPKVVDAMLKLADVQRGEVLFDLGSGDGIVCITAAKEYGAHAFGYEIQAERVKDALENVKKNQVERLVTIERRDIFKVDLSEADVVTFWLLPFLNAKLIPQLQKLKPGARIVSQDFDLCGIAKPDKVVELKKLRPPSWFDSGDTTLFLWKAPLKINKEVYREYLGRHPTLKPSGK